jgi:hypothetical protein
VIDMAKTRRSQSRQEVDSFLTPFIPSAIGAEFVSLVMTLHARCVVTSSGPSRRHLAAGRWMIRCN